jgi:hypothetical protein
MIKKVRVLKVCETKRSQLYGSKVEKNIFCGQRF